MNDNFYNQDYRHFDIMIWQMPSWVSAIFAVSIGTAATIAENVKNVIVVPLSNGDSYFDGNRLAGCFLLIMSLVLLLFFNILYRMRIYQLDSQRNISRNTVSVKFSFSGATSLQLILAVETFALVGFSFLFIGFPPVIFIGTGMALVILLFFVESEIYQAKRDKQLLND